MRDIQRLNVTENKKLLSALTRKNEVMKVQFPEDQCGNAEQHQWEELGGVQGRAGGCHQKHLKAWARMSI